MRRHRELLLAAWLAVGLAFLPAASASILLGGPQQEYSEDETAAQRFLRRYWQQLIVALPIAMGVMYIIIMGPADVLDSWRRLPRRGRWGRYNSYGGFGGRGGFGDDPNRGNPWL
jgi:hypothetical protein